MTQSSISKNLNKLFPPKLYKQASPKGLTSTQKQYNKDELSILIRSKEHADEASKKMYNNFNDQLSLYLSKMSDSVPKKVVSELLLRDLIYIGLASRANEHGVFVRVLYKDNKLTGVGLDARDLSISIKDGSCDDISDCIYASYYGAIRTCVLEFEKEINKDETVNKIAYSYILTAILKSIGKKIPLNIKQKDILKIAVAYLYFRHYQKERHLSALNRIEKEFGELINHKVFLEVFKNNKNIEKFDNIKEVGHLLSTLRIFYDNPNVILLHMLQNFKKNVFYNIITSLDTLVAMMVTAIHPNYLFDSSAVILSKLQSHLENHMFEKYFKRLKFADFKI